MECDVPITLSIKKSDRKVYEELLKTSELKSLSNKDIFLLSALIGFKNKKNIPIKGAKDSYVRTEYLKDEDYSIINSIAIIDSDNLEIIFNKKEVFEIVEEYAHGGIEILKNMLFEKNSGSFVKKFEVYLRGCLKSN